MLRKGLVIYEPKGRAGEYAPLAVNLYRGCGHGCVYCFAPSATFMDPEEFKKATPRATIIERLKREAPVAAATYDGEDKRVLLCFTCDPYQAIDETYQLTRRAIQILHANGFTVDILTKGGNRAYRDFDLLRKGDHFATTLTFFDEEKSLKWEPGAATPEERIRTLKEAHYKGIETWVSLEPVIDPAASLNIILETHTFVDLFKVGKLNYAEKLPERFRSQVRDIDWHKFAKDVIAVLEQYGCRYYIKQDLRAYL